MEKSRVLIKNQVLSGGDKDKQNQLEPFKGAKYYGKNTQKAGQLRPAFKEWEKQNQNHPNFRATPTQDKMLSSGGRYVNTQTHIDKRKKEITLKPSSKFVLSHGVKRDKPDSSEVFKVIWRSEDDNNVDALIQKLSTEQGIRVLHWKNQNTQIFLSGNVNENIRTLMSAISVNSDESHFEKENEFTGQEEFDVNILRYDDVKFQKKKNTQLYAENTTNTCITDPIKKYIELHCPNKRERHLKTISNAEKKNPDGMNVEAIQRLCNTLQVSVVIKSALNQIIENIRCKGKPKKTFPFKNTHEGHAEPWDFDNSKPIMIATSMEMTEIYRNLRRNKEAFNYTKSSRIQGSMPIACIETKDACYKYDDPLTPYEEELYAKYPFLNHGISCDPDDLTGSNYFINSATLINGVHDFHEYDKNEPIVEHDLIKAYAKIQENPYWEHYGVPSIPTDFRCCLGEPTEEIISKFGWTQIKNIVGHDGAAFELASLVEYGVRPNIELKTLWDLGTRFDCVETCYSTRNNKFEFPKHFLEEIDTDELGLKKLFDIPFDHHAGKPYPLIAGKMLAFSSTSQKIYVYDKEPTQEFIDDMAFNHPDIVKIYNNTLHKELIIIKKKKKIHTRNHISSHITAYVRSSMYMQVEKYDKDDLITVRSDAIKFKKSALHKYPTPKGFQLKVKNVKGHHNETYQDYVNHKEVRTDWDTGVWKSLKKNVVFIGAGGTGKTYDFMNDKGLINKCIALPTNNLKVRLNTTLDKYTHHGCAGLQTMGKRSCTQTFDKIHYGNIMIDEITMRCGVDIALMKKMDVPRKIFAGDWDQETGMPYQLQAVDSIFPHEMFKNSQFIKFETNYRINDDNLKHLLSALRTEMKERYNSQYANTLFNMNCKYTNGLKTITKEEVNDLYTIDDTIICGRNKDKDYFNNLIDLPVKKWKTTAMINIETPRGTIFNDEEIITTNKKLAYAQSIHSVQGETFENKLFVNFGGLFEWGHLYTAISRLRTMDNLIIIK